MTELRNGQLAGTVLWKERVKALATGLLGWGGSSDIKEFYEPWSRLKAPVTGTDDDLWWDPLLNGGTLTPADGCMKMAHDGSVNFNVLRTNTLIFNMTQPWAGAHRMALPNTTGGALSNETRTAGFQCADGNFVFCGIDTNAGGSGTKFVIQTASGKHVTAADIDQGTGIAPKFLTWFLYWLGGTVHVLLGGVEIYSEAIAFGDKGRPFFDWENGTGTCIVSDQVWTGGQSLTVF